MPKENICKDLYEKAKNVEIFTDLMQLGRVQTTESTIITKNIKAEYKISNLSWVKILLKSLRRQKKAEGLISKFVAFSVIIPLTKSIG